MEISEISHSFNVKPLSSQNTEINFDDYLVEELKEINSHIINAENSVHGLASGEVDNIHQVMIEISKAQTSFELAVQVRNRMVESFQQIMKMPI